MQNINTNIVSFPKSLVTVQLEQRQIMPKAAVVFFLSCMEGCLTIPVPRSIIINCGVH